MKKLLYYMAAMTVAFFTACDDMDHAIADQTDRLDQLENLSIKEIKDQITAVNASIEDLEAVDKELDGYIKALQTTAGNLETELEEVRAGIDSLKSELEGGISSAKQELLDKLTELQKEIEDELAAVREDIEALEAKDEELEGKIEELKTYVDEELAKAEDWAEATFATLEQYEALQNEVAEINESISVINKSITDLETRVNEKIAADIKTAVDALRTELGKDYSDKIDAAVKEVTEGCTAAVAAAKEEIMAACTKAITDAIAASEKGMKEWVNKTLAEGYYDIAAIDAKLKELETILTGDDAELAEQIEAQKEALEQAKADLEEAYEMAIADAIETNNGVITEAYEEAIDDAVAELNTTISGINTAIDEIKGKLGLLEQEVEALKTRIQSIRFMPEYSDGKVELDGSVTLKFVLAPKAAAGEIQSGHVTSFISRTKERTKAAEGPAALTVETVEGDEATGILEVVINGTSLDADFWADGNNANTYICISDGNNDVISEMIPTFTRPYVTFNADAEQTLKMSDAVAVRSSGASEGFEYSVGWGEWTALTTGEYVTFGGTLGALRLRGRSETGTEGKKIEFGHNTEVAASGDIRTLIDWTGHDTAETGKAVFAGLFQGCTQLTSAPELPSTELAEGCYANMFADCTNLTEAPVLPAPVLTENCYQGMFSGCSSLKSVTMLATDTSAEGCMNGMLENVTLTEPSEIVATSAEDLINKIDNVPVGSTIRLGADITSTTTITIQKGLTLDGNDYTVTFTTVGNNRMVEVSNGTDGASLTLKNITLVNNASYAERGVNYNTYGTLTLDNVTIKSTEGRSITYAVNCPSKSDNATVEIRNSCLTGNIALNLWGENMKVNVVDSELCNYDNADHENYSTIVLNNNGTDSAKGSVVTISGGKISALDENDELCTAVSNPALGTVTISETTEVTGHLRNNVAIVDYGTDQHYGCITLESAISKAMDDNALVRLLSDVELEGSITIPTNNKLTLDLNGYTISQEKECTGSYSMITNAGDLTITGNGTINFTDTSSGNGSVWGTYIITNQGTLTIENGTLEHFGSTGNWGNNRPTNIPIQNYAGKVTIKDGTFSSPMFRSVRDFTAGGEIIIEGGTFKGQIWMQGLGTGSSSLTIKGGNFSPTAGYDGSSVYITNETNQINVTIEGGHFNTKIGAANSNKEGVSGCVKGGIFTDSAKNDTNTALIATGYNFVSNNDGTWTVTDEAINPQ